MLPRIVTALVGIPIAVALVFYRGGLPFAVAVGVVSFLGALEFYGGVRKRGVRPVEWAGLVAVILFVVSARTYERATISSVFPAVLTLLLILSFCVELMRRERSPIVNVGATLFGAIYVGWLISHLVVLRGVGGTVTLGPYVLSAPWIGWTLTIGPYSSAVGAWLVMFTFLCTWACDTGAFVIGKRFGKTKIAPKLSPNKTVEGSIGGFLGSVVIALVTALVIKLPLGHALALGAMFGVLSQLGDLSESAIKREIGIKDFGKAVPGHGGVLDRFDSLFFTGPAAFYYVILFLENWPS